MWLRVFGSPLYFKWTKYFRCDLTPILEDAQCFSSISEPSQKYEKLVEWIKTFQLGGNGSRRLARVESNFRVN